MKKVKVTILWLLSVVLLNAQTTEEEYNYLTKGYKIQLESGLDMKAGYKLNLITSSNTTFDNVKRIVEFHSLIKTSNNTQCAVLMVYKKENESQFYCIPTLNSSIEMRSRAFRYLTTDFGGFSNEKFKTIIWGLLQFCMTNEAKKVNLNDLLKGIEPPKLN